MQKIIIIGLTGSGKTTLAKKISGKLNIPIYYLDLIFWNENGHLKDGDFIKEQEKIIFYSKWIIDGGFPKSKSLDLRIVSADTIIFYDLPLCLVFWRQLKRYFEYYNKVRPDFGKKQPFPFTLKDLKYSFFYPRNHIYEKINELGTGKNIVIIKGNKDQEKFINTLQN